VKQKTRVLSRATAFESLRIPSIRLELLNVFLNMTKKVIVPGSTYKLATDVLRSLLALLHETMNRPKTIIPVPNDSVDFTPSVTSKYIASFLVLTP
jgi:hypothetical protein